MRIDGAVATTAASRIDHPREPVSRTHEDGDVISLSALAAGDVDAKATSHTSGLIASNTSQALSVHRDLEPERALRLVGLLD